jgi:hypothetical protein
VHGLCCYVVTEETGVCVGRPLVIDERPRAAAGRRGDGWAVGREPACAELGRAERAALAKAWLAAALGEHASIASFARFSLELLAVGAPAELVAGAHAAALDEVRHAELCFALASAYAGEELTAGRLDAACAAWSAVSLAEMARATARDGCIGETVAAVIAAEQLARATDPAVRAALETIARDEAAHAELAWRTVAWALEVGGAPVLRAVSEVFRDAVRHAPDAGDAFAPWLSSPAMASHGLLARADADAVVESALAEIVRPCAARLLGNAAARAALQEAAHAA